MTKLSRADKSLLDGRYQTRLASLRLAVS